LAPACPPVLFLRVATGVLTLHQQAAAGDQEAARVLAAMAALLPPSR
jgi:hypothetical protein